MLYFRRQKLNSYVKVKKKNSQRQLKVSEHLKRSLSEVIQSLTFKVFNSYFTIIISEVNVSVDLKVADVFILPFFEKNELIADSEILNVIYKESSQIKKKLSGYVGLRFTPKIIFKIDNLSKETQKIEKLFKDPKIAQDLK